MLKAYQCDEYDLYAAATPEQAVQAYRDHCGEEIETEDGYPRELTEAELDVQHPAFDENENPIEGMTITVRQMLIEHGDEPGWLAGNEW